MEGKKGTRKFLIPKHVKMQNACLSIQQTIQNGQKDKRKVRVGIALYSHSCWHIHNGLQMSIFANYKLYLGERVLFM